MAEEQSRSPEDTLTPEERLKTSWTLLEKADINDFLCSYTNRAVHILRKTVRTGEEPPVYRNEKDTYEEQHRTEGTCGYSSCTNMVRAIHNGVNIKETVCTMCMAEEEAKDCRTSEIRADGTEIRQQKITDITDRFVTPGWITLQN